MQMTGSHQSVHNKVIIAATKVVCMVLLEMPTLHRRSHLNDSIICRVG